VKAEDNQETGLKEKTETGKLKLIPIYVMGKRYQVPHALTIMKALEYAGYRFIRGCGCRGGICGACATVYRKPGDYHLYVGLACQTVVEPDMYLTQIPFYPANRAHYDFAQLTVEPEEIFKLYPEVFRCIACNSCTKACPMDIPMMDVISAVKQGAIARAAGLSFSCIQCGLCVSRCMGELPQYHIAQLARRIHGSKLIPRAPHLTAAMTAAKDEKCQKMLGGLMKSDIRQLITSYNSREIEPEMAADDWTPANCDYL
jgi:formate hydrogenlyase subunit 6/NADH:ubiquinone oxidoreductase subunit I|tara:strand:+ start:140 stop:913 length:774 start_codon:yes stop_codon:yes gene_type:complete